MGITVEAVPYPAWTRPVDEVLDRYHVTTKEGLNDVEVEFRRETFGWNELKKEPGKSLWSLVLEQF